MAAVKSAALFFPTDIVPLGLGRVAGGTEEL